MRINITYPDDKLKKTDEVAKLLGLSRSSFIALCVSHYITTVLDTRRTYGQSKIYTDLNR